MPRSGLEATGAEDGAGCAEGIGARRAYGDRPQNAGLEVGNSQSYAQIARAPLTMGLCGQISRRAHIASRNDDQGSGSLRGEGRLSHVIP